MGLEVPDDPAVLTGIRGAEDAGVYRISDDTALVQTIDFFTPIVDDPRVFGRAAAANSLSDVYAMGGKPVSALNVVCFPLEKLGIETLREILAGGLDVLREAGCALVGGHSVDDDEPKYGLSVTGIVHPDKIMRNAGFKAGQKIVLTKAIGTGLIATALKADMAEPTAIDAMVESMCTLNRIASEIAVEHGVLAATDVTGFGLAGHLVESAKASDCTIRLDSSVVPKLSGALEAASMGLVPAGAHANRKFFGEWTKIAPTVTPETIDLMFDPQTSGGLVLGIAEEKADELIRALHAAGVPLAVAIGETRALEEDTHLEIA